MTATDDTTQQVDGQKEEDGRAKKAASGGWDWFKGKRGDKALLATIATAVVGGLAVAGIVVPQQAVERRLGVVESRLDGVLDRLDAVDGALSSIQSVDPVGFVSTLAPQVKDLAGQVGSIRERLGGGPTSSSSSPTSSLPTSSPTVATTVTVASTAPAADGTVLARLGSAEKKLDELATSLEAQQQTSATLNAAVASIRSDVATVRGDIAAVRATADQANTAAAAARADVAALSGRVVELESRVATLEARQRTLKFGESAVAGPNNGVFVTLSTVTAGKGRAFARWGWFHSPANGNCVAQVRMVDADDTPVQSATLIGDSHPNTGIYGLQATWDAGAGGTFRLQTAVSGNVVCTMNRVFAEVEATG